MYAARMGELSGRAARIVCTYVVNMVIIGWRVNRFVSLRNFRKITRREIFSACTNSTGFPTSGVENLNLVSAIPSGKLAFSLSDL
jgi:hypothetical protein